MHPSFIMKYFSTVPILFICLLLWSGLAAAGFNSTPTDLTDACDALARRLVHGIPDGKSVAVRPFLSSGGIRTLLSIRVQDLLTNALSAVSPRKFHVVERLRMAELDAERLTFGASTGEDLDEWARGLKADAVVTGSYGEADNHLNIHCRLLAPESGRSLGAAHVQLPLTPDVKRLAHTPAPSNATAGVFEAVSGPAKRGKPRGNFLRLFRVQEGKPVAFFPGDPPGFRVGELMGFSVCPPMDCRLYIFNYDPRSEDDSVIFLYPLPQVPARIFKKKVSCFFPASVDPGAVSYPVEAPLGRMVVKVIGVEQQASYADLVDGLEWTMGYYQLRQKDLKPLIHRLALLPRSAWWEESVEFWVLE